ncbi:HAD family acid phosphatase [uncultured Gimesia sp.]|uniref:5'-nucleotidase, lipoprotein e(P4) family n=1 Tax=uncultured Gimesia sp. TaxID=1678688 RepID=UPI0030D9F9E5|tara:strand:+ start:2527 stop:3378 length:852 start_codon:yes stop_codon:yes gene_type:complete
MPKFLFLLFLLSWTTLTTHAQEPESPTIAPSQTDQGLNATLWMQTSVEHDFACIQSYRLATMQATQALHDPCWTATTEQQAGYAQLPPAVILDLDETVLNNALFMGQLVKHDTSWNEILWEQWVRSKRSTAVPGVKPFLQHLVAQGIAVYFITNRDVKLETPTVENLSRVLDMPITKSQVLFQKEKPDWTWNKTSRRAAVACSHRILLLLGDDFNDFVYQGKLPPKERVEQGKRYQEYWGRRWIILPNPVYGDWEKSLYLYESSLPTAKKIQLKFDALKIDND